MLETTHLDVADDSLPMLGFLEDIMRVSAQRRQYEWGLRTNCFKRACFAGMTSWRASWMVCGACQTTLSSAGLETTGLGRGVSAAAEATPCERLWDKGDTSEHDGVKGGGARGGRDLDTAASSGRFIARSWMARTPPASGV